MKSYFDCDNFMKVTREIDAIPKILLRRLRKVHRRALKMHRRSSLELFDYSLEGDTKVPFVILKITFINNDGAFL